jgi:hypothetical protein
MSNYTFLICICNKKSKKQKTCYLNPKNEPGSLLTIYRSPIIINQKQIEILCQHLAVVLFCKNLQY